MKCAKYNPPTSGYVKQPLKPIETFSRFELVCYDLAGPFMPKTVRGNVYALIIVDHFTKWPEIVPIPDSTAPTLAQTIFDYWICRYGIMQRLHSDGANNVDGHVMKQVSKLLGIGKSKSSRLHPQGDGLAEAIVKLAKSIIQKQVDDHGNDWDLYLQPAAFAIRSNINNSTGLSPAELMIGQNLTHPSDIIHDKCTKNMSFNARQAKQFAEELKTKLSESNRIAKETLDKTRARIKQTYDKNTTKHRFDIGDNVMLWNPPNRKRISRTFQPKWS